MDLKNALRILEAWETSPNDVITWKQICEAVATVVSFLPPVQWKGCEHCHDEPFYKWRPGAHEFRIDGAEIYYYDTDDGWEGEEINFCPWCGRPLRDQYMQLLMERLGVEHGKENT